jgi:hypothetical protein
MEQYSYELVPINEFKAHCAIVDDTHTRHSVSAILQRVKKTQLEIMKANSDNPHLAPRTFVCISAQQRETKEHFLAAAREAELQGYYATVEEQIDTIYMTVSLPKEK